MLTTICSTTMRSRAGRISLSHKSREYSPFRFICSLLQIKDRLLVEDKRIEAFELRKNKDNNRKFNKQVKELRKQEGAQQRKAQISEVSNLRKDAAKEGKSSEEKVKAMIDEGPATKSKKRVNMVSAVVPSVLHRECTFIRTR
jgi:TolA-binding protein